MAHLQTTWLLFSLVYAGSTITVMWRSTHLNGFTIAIPATRILRLNLIGLIVLGMTMSLGWRYAIYLQLMVLCAIALQYWSRIEARGATMEIRNTFEHSRVRLEDVTSAIIRIADIDGVPWVGKKVLTLEDGRRINLSGIDMSSALLSALGEKVVVDGGHAHKLISLTTRGRLITFVACVVLLVMNITGAFGLAS